MDPNKQRKNLPRLPRETYRGFAFVHWVFTMHGRRTGWLTPEFSLRFQLIATHAFLRYRIASPCVCLMPDHLHMLLMGHDEITSDQSLAIEFLRKHLKPHLEERGFEFQRPAYDHVLREKEREHGAFQATATYIRRNPHRAGLVTEEDAPWAYEFAVVPGYPNLKIRAPDFWDRFWRIYYRLQKTAE